MKLGNVPIGKKLGLITIGAILQVACVIGIAIWSLHAVAGLTQDSEQESKELWLAERVAGCTVRSILHVGGMTFVKDSQGERAALATARQEYLAIFKQLKSWQKDDRGRQLIEDYEAAVATLRDGDNRVIELASAGRKAEAGAVYASEVLSRMGNLEHAMEALVKAKEQDLAAINVHRDEFTSRVQWALLIGFGLIGLPTGVLLGFLLARSISRPLQAVVGHLNDVAAGDISRDLASEYSTRGDEIGTLAKSVGSMSGHLRQIIRSIADGTHMLSSSSTELSATSGVMSEGSRKTSSKSHTVAAAAEQMSANVTSVAASVEQASANLNHVASATEQMTLTIGEIARISEKARRITDEATRRAQDISTQMAGLGHAAREIGKVTETITEISSQTNLLALNATIEAARAGAAGKGFAVVANEIKELAQQTAAATEDIKGKIDGVQSATTDSVSQIEQISRVIQEVSEIVSSTAAAIEEQSTVTKEIARNIGEASAGVGEVTSRVSEASIASREIAREISGIDQAAGEIAQGSQEVLGSSTELSRLAEQLQATVTRFRV